MTNVRLQHTKAINSLTTKIEALNKQIETVTQLPQVLTDLDLEIDAKNQEIEGLEKQYHTLEQEGRIEFKNNLAEFKHEAAVKYLEEVGEIAVQANQYNQIKQELDTVKSSMKGEIDVTRKEESVKAKRQLEAALSNQDLRHKAEIAELTAQAAQLRNEQKVLHDTIKNLKEEISAQRQLTKSVADAGRQGAINQSFSRQ